MIMAHPIKPSTGWKWIEAADSVDSWFTMESTLRLKLASLKITWVMEPAEIAKRFKPEPAPFGALPVMIPGASLTERDTYDRDLKNWVVLDNIYKKWEEHDTAIEAACSQAIAALLVQFSVDSWPISLEQSMIKVDSVGGVNVQKPAREIWLFLWHAVIDRFGPYKPESKIRLRKKWMDFTDKGISFAEFAMGYETCLAALRNSGINPTEAEEEAVLLGAVGNPEIKRILMDTLSESYMVPVPFPRIHSIASFWQKARAVSALDHTIGNWGVKVKANFGETSAQSSHPAKERAPVQSGRPVAAKGVTPKAGDLQKGAGSVSGQKRERQPVDLAQSTCWRCGKLGHRIYEGPTGRCTATVCTVCHKTIGLERHDARACTGASSTDPQGSGAKRART